MSDHGDATREVRVRVKPGSRKGPLVEPGDDGVLTVFVRERAIEGKANEAVERALAAHFGRAPSRVRVVRGHTARIKTVRID
ncbi:DUF167 domain-containing protein [Lysinimonas soli]|uniref:DUF167 domain-containing protein n=1 Tax=Lysinimonas soli TaxID=1074233 RepID=A0ABW0NMQ2_9MICO